MLGSHYSCRSLASLRRGLPPACWRLITVSGCSTPAAIGPTVNTQPKLAGQPVSLDTLAYDPAPTGAVPLPSPSSQAVATTEPGDGQMIGAAARRPSGGGSAANVVLNLSSVPLQQAAKTVLGDMIGVNYVVDPRVDGVVSVQTTQPVNKADALEMFQAALAPIGAVLVQSRGIYRIAPADQAATGVISTGQAPSGGTVGGNGIRVVPLKYVSATEVARVLEPMVPKGAIVQADDARNILAFKGSPAEIDSMLDSISIFDVDVMRGMSFAVVPVKTSQPEKMVDELKAVFASDKEGPLKGRVRFIANTRLGAILVVTSQPSYLPRAQELDQAARCQGNRHRTAAACLSGAEPSCRGACDRASVDVLQRNEGRDVRRRSVSPRSKQVGLMGSSAKSPGPGARHRRTRIQPCKAVVFAASVPMPICRACRAR